MIDSKADDTWELKDPHDGSVREKISARELWQRILELRMQTGEPYLHYIDTSNKAMPEFQKKLGLKIRQSNLCSEIILPTDKDRTAVCCLSSVNLEYYDEWKNNKQFLRDVAEMLDNVLQYFIDNAPDSISRAVYSASRERSIGVGALGFHAYLQKIQVPFESALAVSKNKQMFKHIREGLDNANRELGKERGEAPDARGTGLRFSHTTAIAPNACQSKTNKIRTTTGIVELGDLLVTAGIDVQKIENTNEKQWVSVQEKVSVPTLEGVKEVEKVWYNGIEEVTEIEFEDGKKFKFTENHLLLVRTADNSSKWVRVGDLTGEEEIISV